MVPSYLARVDAAVAPDPACSANRSICRGTKQVTTDDQIKDVFLLDWLADGSVPREPAAPTAPSTETQNRLPQTTK